MRIAQHPFTFADNTVVVDIYGLIAKLQSISEFEFESFVTETKHDFANWVKHSLQSDELARLLLGARSRAHCLAVLQSYVAQRPIVTSQAQNTQMYQPPTQTIAQPITKPSQYYPSQSEQTPYEKHNAVDIAALDEANRSADSKYMPQYQVADEAKSQPAAGYDVNPYREDSQNQNDGATAQQVVVDAKPQPAAGYDVNPYREDSQNQHVAVTPQVVEVKKEELASVTSSMPPNKVQAPAAPSDTVSLEKIKEYSKIMNDMKTEIHKIFIGQEEVVNQTVLSILCQAHLLMEGVPGLAKSLLVEMLGRTVKGTKFNRIQFLPDMLPSDVIGGQIYNPKTGEFTTNKGPIFANFLLADEINRAPPKTHAALMEAMAERKINIDKEEFQLDAPFLVIATQNPLENKGTYELPEAVLDRFMFKVVMEYPKRNEEIMIISSNNTTSPERKAGVRQVCDKQKILEMQLATRKIYLSDRIKEYILNIVEATRGQNKQIEGIKFVKYGAGPRATIALAIGARAQALMEGRNYVLPADVNAVSKSILRHRVSLNFKGKAYGISADKIVEEILSKVKEN